MKLEEIARLAGVSRTTASYVINGKGKRYRVSDNTIQRVLEIVEKHQFQPNAIAAGLRAGRTRSFGVVIPDLNNGSYTRIAHHVEQLARKNGYQLLLSCSEDDPDIEKACINHLYQRRVDAIIVASACSKLDPFYASWNHDILPIFCIDRSIDEHFFCTVRGDDYEDASVLAREFCQYAGATPLYLGAQQHLPVSQLRENGFFRIWNEQFPSLPVLYSDRYTRSSAKDAVLRWYSQSGANMPLPSSVFSTSFSLLQGVIDAFLEIYSGLPETLFLATFGDNELLDFLPCPVVSLSQCHEQIAQNLVNLIFRTLSSRYYFPGDSVIKRHLMYRGKLSRK